jgi:hypothetical protein
LVRFEDLTILQRLRASFGLLATEGLQVMGQTFDISNEQEETAHHYLEQFQQHLSYHIGKSKTIGDCYFKGLEVLDCAATTTTTIALFT